MTETRFAAFEYGSREVARDKAAQTVRALLETALDQSDADSVLWSSGIDCAALAALKPDLHPRLRPACPGLATGDPDG